MTKIAFIGAGSLTFTNNLVRDIMTFPLLKDATLALMDIDAERLEYSTRAVKRIIELGNYPAKVEPTLDRAEALKDTPHVLIVPIADRVGEVRAFGGGHSDLGAGGRHAVRPAGLVAMVVSEDDLLHRGDPQLGKRVGHAPVAAVDQQGFRAVTDDAHVDRPVIDQQVFREPGRAAQGRRTLALCVLRGNGRKLLCPGQGGRRGRGTLEETASR